MSHRPRMMIRKLLVDWRRLWDWIASLDFGFRRILSFKILAKLISECILRSFVVGFGKWFGNLRGHSDRANVYEFEYWAHICDELPQHCEIFEALQSDQQDCSDNRWERYVIGWSNSWCAPSQDFSDVSHVRSPINGLPWFDSEEAKWLGSWMVSRML
jgi:hypothetical protein